MNKHLKRNINTYPGLPDWLVRWQKDAEKKNIQNNELWLVIDAFKQAETQARTAESVARQFETGQFPVGVQSDEAIMWYEHALKLGSSNAAIRLFYLRGVPDPLIQVLKHSLSLLKEQETPHRANNLVKEHRIVLSACAEQLVECALKHGSDDFAKDCMNLLQSYADSPFYAALTSDLQASIEARINELRKHLKVDEPYKLNVVSTTIVEDGDFKAGIYTVLTKHTPLIKLQNIDQMKAQLDAEFPWFEELNSLIHLQLTTQLMSAMPVFKLRPILLVGAPGVGKTSWANRLAELCAVPFKVVMAGGSADSMNLRGLSRGWGGARPSGVLHTIATEKVANPLYLVDELDKASSDNRNGRIWDVLLQLMEPATAKAYFDECLQVPANVSHVSWIATANNLGVLPKPLLERFTIVHIKPPEQKHFDAILSGALSGLAKEMGVDRRMLPSLDSNDVDILKLCKNPREINRTARFITEKKMHIERKTLRSH